MYKNLQCVTGPHDGEDFESTGSDLVATISRLLAEVLPDTIYSLTQECVERADADASQPPEHAVIHQRYRAALQSAYLRHDGIRERRGIRTQPVEAPQQPCPALQNSRHCCMYTRTLGLCTTAPDCSTCSRGPTGRSAVPRCLGTGAAGNLPCLAPHRAGKSCAEMATSTVEQRVIMTVTKMGHQKQYLGAELGGAQRRDFCRRRQQRRMVPPQLAQCPHRIRGCLWHTIQSAICMTYHALVPTTVAINEA